MKARLLSLAALLFAGAAQGAMAQDHWRAGGPGVPPGQGQGQNPGQNQGQPQNEGQAGAPPQAAPDRSQAPGGGQRGQWREGGGERPSGWNGQMGRDHGFHGDHAPQGGPRPQGPRPEGPRPDGDPRFNGERGRWEGGGAPGEHRGGNRGEWDRNDPRNAPGRGEWNRGGRPDGGDRQAWSRGERHDTGRWAPRRFPPSYHSPSRFRAPWRPPHGYYARAWRFGEILPYGWYEPDYRLFDWWEFGLPEPPPGYDWVRVGDDALLVDDDTGRIVQVVRFVFW